MNASQMLHQMCHDVLSNADLKAIAKSRGFSAKETASRALLENFFLSDIGVEAAMAALTAEEIALLHLLQFTGEAVGVAVFERIYGDEKATGRRYYGTFTQRYKNVFKKVRLSLVRKGVLLMAEDRDVLSAKTKMERWRFRFPREFERFLPPLVRSTRRLERKGDVRADVLRHKLMEVVTGKRSSPVSAKTQFDLRLVDGELRMGDRVFRASHLEEWQWACWEAAAPSPKVKAWLDRGGITVSLIEATTYVLAQLGENEWIRPGQLSQPLRVFCDALLSGEEICTAGWMWGCLARQEVDDKTYYRLAEMGTGGRGQEPSSRAQAEGTGPSVGPGVDPEYYLYAAPDRSLVVNLEAVPYQSLEHLVQISDMRVADSGRPHLIAFPNLIKMGNAPESIWDQPLTGWLQENAPAFRQALETVRQRWGKQIIHENLMIAQVSDLGLKVQLERSFSGEVVFLPNDYVAFSRDLFAVIERMVTKAGYVIRTVGADG